MTRFRSSKRYYKREYRKYLFSSKYILQILFDIIIILIERKLKYSTLQSTCDLIRLFNMQLRVILLEDNETVHNAFFDRDFVP